MNFLLAKDELVFSNMDSLWWAAPVFAVTLGLILVLYTLERRLIKRWAGWLLVAIRIALVVLLCLLFLEPIVASYHTSVQPTTVAVLVDDSLSMDVSNDPLTDSQRLRIAEALGLLPEGIRRVRLERTADALAADTESLADLQVSLETFRRQVAEGTLTESQLAGRLARIVELTGSLQTAVKRARDGLAGLLAANLVTAADGQLRTADEELATGMASSLARIATAAEDAAKQKAEQFTEPVAAGWILLCQDAAAARGRAADAIRQAGAFLDEQLINGGDARVRDAIAQVSASSRGEIARRLLDGGGLMKVLADRGYRIQAYRFNKQPVPEAADGRAPASQPAGMRAFTDIAAALARVQADTAAPHRLGGVLLLTDGQHNRPDSARRAATVLGAPIYSIALGSDRRPKDIAVASVVADTSYAKDVAEVFAQIKTDGLPEGMPLRVLLTEGEKIVDSRPLIVPEEGKLSTLRFQFPAGEVVGPRKMVVSIDPLPGEAFTENNQKSFTLHVTDKKIRVLLIDGPPRWCFQYIRNVLQRDKKVELTTILLAPAAIALSGDALDEGPGRKLLAEQVGAKDKLLAYDVVVFGDVDPDMLDNQQMSNLHDFVLNRGGAMILISGKQYLPAAYGNTPLKDLICVRLPSEPAAGRTPADGGSPEHMPPFLLRMTAEGAGHDICRLEEDDKANQQAWSRMPAFLWRSPYGHARENATVLAWAEELPDPAAPSPAGPSVGRGELQKRNAVILTARYGLGKVLYLATDHMWRFRYRQGDKYHHRYWGQVLRWATSEKLNVQLKHFGLGTDEIVYDEGKTIPVTARVLTEEMIPLAGGVVRAELTSDDNIVARTLLIYQPDSGGLYQGSFARVPAGNYKLRLDVPPEMAELLNKETDGAGVSLDLEVRDQPSAERIELATNTPLLEAIAAASGGRVFRVDNAAGVLAALPEPRWETPPQYSGFRLWDSWFVLAIFVGLVTIEWVLRKKTGLI